MKSSSQAVGAMKVMTNVAFHIKVHGLFISGLDAVAKADNAQVPFDHCCDIAVVPYAAVTSSPSRNSWSRDALK